jgi:hypothetical protein
VNYKCISQVLILELAKDSLLFLLLLANVIYLVLIILFCILQCIDLQVVNNKLLMEVKY